jgi:hypothetical protein
VPSATNARRSGSIPCGDYEGKLEAKPACNVEGVEAQTIALRDSDYSVLSSQGVL